MANGDYNGGMNTTTPSVIWPWNRVLHTGYTILTTVEVCTMQGNLLRITYRPETGDTVVRVVKPENVSTTQDRNMILHASRQENGETVQRSYRLDRIENIDILPDLREM